MNPQPQKTHENPPSQRWLQTGELQLSYFEWGNPDAPTVLLVHATGFHARCWDQVVARLPCDVHVLALDMRGHGRSDKVAPYTWSAFARDLGRFAELLDIRDAIGVGHSMGGHCVTRLAGENPAVFRQLILLDPVIFSELSYQDPSPPAYATAADHPVAMRRQHWRSWQAMADSLRSKGSFGVWDAAVFDDYCQYGVLSNTAGDGVSLACPALVEASVYLNNTESNLYELLPRINIPVQVLRARPPEPLSQAMDFSRSPTAPELASYFVQGTDRLLPELTHFIPMQAPQLVADTIIQALC